MRATELACIIGGGVMAVIAGTATASFGLAPADAALAAMTAPPEAPPATPALEQVSSDVAVARATPADLVWTKSSAPDAQPSNGFVKDDAAADRVAADAGVDEPLAPPAADVEVEVMGEAAPPSADGAALADEAVRSDNSPAPDADAAPVATSADQARIRPIA